MLVVTDTAGEHLIKLLEQLRPEEDLVPRLVVTDSGQVRLKLDRESLGDVSFNREGKTILLVDPDSLFATDNKVLDVENSTGRSRLELR